MKTKPGKLFITEGKMTLTPDGKILMNRLDMPLTAFICHQLGVNFPAHDGRKGNIVLGRTKIWIEREE